MAAFFLVMALYPEVQKRAQAELDAVVGRDRLPDFSDSPSLPYINAIVKELLRWHPAAPLGFPHRSVEDGEYNGHLIPAGATIFVNIWCVLDRASRRRMDRLTYSVGTSSATPKFIPTPRTSFRSVSWTRRGTWTSRDGTLQT